MYRKIEFAAKEKLEIVASFQEDKTAKEPGRMKFAEMLSLIVGGKADGIISWHPDRLARNSVEDMRLADQIDQITFSAHHAKLEREKEQLMRFQDNIDMKISEWFKKAENYLEFAERAELEFDQGSPEKKRKILAALGYNHSLKDKKLNVSKLKVFSTIEKLNSEARKILGRLEPIKSVAAQRRIKDLYSKSSLMCPRQESNPHQRLRRALLYPLSYEGNLAVRGEGLEPTTFRV